MTGFGKAVVELNNKTVHIEVRSVNSKNFDFYARMPQHLREKEPEMRKLAQSILNRGKVEINLSETQGELSSSVSINTVALKKHFESINTVAKDLGLNADADLLGSIMRIPDVLVPEQMELDPEEWEQIKVAFNEACLSMDEFRKREGAALKTDFETSTNHIRTYQKEIKPYEGERIHHI